MKRQPFPERLGRDLVYARSDGNCEPRVVGVCTGRATEWQHRKARSHSGTWAPSNGLHCCHECHAWIHANPIQAIAKGWTVPSWADPAEVPFEHHLFGPMFLDDSGDLHFPREEQTA